MKKHKYALLLLLLTSSLSVPSVALARVTITEVMYNPPGSDAGREWIELHNSGSDVVELSAGQKGWKVSDGSNHLLATTTRVPPGSFVIVASNPTVFAAQYGTAVVIVKSALNLNNTASTLSLLNAEGKIVDTISYTKNLGGFEDGMSLHRVSDTVTPGAPNPGGLPMPSAPKPIPALVPKATVPAIKTEEKKSPEQPARLTGKSDSPAAVALVAQSVQPGESDSPGDRPQKGGFLWHYILALMALTVFGVASVWYVRPEQTKRSETPSLVDEFDIE